MLLVQYNESTIPKTTSAPTNNPDFTTCRGEYEHGRWTIILRAAQNWFPVTLLGNDLV